MGKFKNYADVEIIKRGIEAQQKKLEADLAALERKHKTRMATLDKWMGIAYAAAIIGGIGVVISIIINST